jgi:hypothetical protein
MERSLKDQADLRIGDIAALMRHARKSASYKPALLKALVRCCQQSDDLQIPLDAIGREFTKLYWNQTVVYHLRQAASLNKESTAVKLIRRTARDYKAHDLAELPAVGRARIDGQMSKLLTVNVLSAFHASRPPAMPPLYRWDPGRDHVAITPTTHAFLKTQAAALELVANFYWAEFLEGCNRLAHRAEGCERRRIAEVAAEVPEDPSGGVELAMLLLRSATRRTTSPNRRPRHPMEFLA